MHVKKVMLLIKRSLFVAVPDCDRAKFEEDINRLNISRGKITALVFIFLEVALIAASYVDQKSDMFQNLNLCYAFMYIIMIPVMIMFLWLFIKFGKDITYHRKGINIIGVIFASFILIWCAGISLLDQMSSGQIIVYTVAILAVAVTPLYKPHVILIIYTCVNVVFITLLHYFSKTSDWIFGNSINSTGFTIISWAISYMRYRRQMKTFNDAKIIQEKSEELKRINIELEKANQKLEKLSQTDGLTGIFNRFMFDKMIEMKWNECVCQLRPLSFLMIDIDFFKLFNDTYGHRAGDECLKKVAEVLLTCVKHPLDIVARYGGEEFAVILPETGKEYAWELAEHIRKKVEELNIPHAYSAVSPYVTISLGINTVYPSNASSIDEFINRADKALYDAKKSRNATVVA
jgi:diguanylate cyclase (GGDEF) domain